MRKLIMIFAVALMPIYSCNSLNMLLKPSDLEVISALQKILDSSALKAVLALQNAQDGLIPEEVQPVLGVLKTLGMGDEIQKVENTITKVAGTVASESGSILKEAVSNISFGDAVAVVLGGEDAATRVLKDAMYATVKNRYSNKLDAELSKVGDVQTFWSAATTAYNLFGKKKINADISDFLAERAVDALFATMGKEEKNIRNDYRSLGDQVVNKVFDYYKNR